MSVIDGKYENKTLWSYSDAVKTDRVPGSEAQADAVNEMISLEERIARKLEDYGINIEEVAGLKAVDQEEDKV